MKTLMICQGVLTCSYRDTCKHRRLHGKLPDKLRLKGVGKGSIEHDIIMGNACEKECPHSIHKLNTCIEVEVDDDIFDKAKREEIEYEYR